MRHTLRGCVDWNLGHDIIKTKSLVTPFVGVWIETEYQPEVYEGDTVTPFVGVWIETALPPFIWAIAKCHTLRGCVDWNTKPINKLSSLVSHTLRGCVDWNLIKENRLNQIRSHTLRGCVDWNRIARSITKRGCSHTLRGCVDWNLINRRYINNYTVTPFVGVWIETANYWHTEKPLQSHPSWVCGLKHNTGRTGNGSRTSHPSWVCGLKQSV